MPDQFLLVRSVRVGFDLCAVDRAGGTCTSRHASNFARPRRDPRALSRGLNRNQVPTYASCETDRRTSAGTITVSGTLPASWVGETAASWGPTRSRGNPPQSSANTAGALAQPLSCDRPAGAYTRGTMPAQSLGSTIRGQWLQEGCGSCNRILVTAVWIARSVEGQVCAVEQVPNTNVVLESC
jgi:hypothetical protein